MHRTKAIATRIPEEMYFHFLALSEEKNINMTDLLKSILIEKMNGIDKDVKLKEGKSIEYLTNDEVDKLKKYLKKTNSLLLEIGRLAEIKAGMHDDTPIKNNFFISNIDIKGSIYSRIHELLMDKDDCHFIRNFLGLK